MAGILNKLRRECRQSSRNTAINAYSSRYSERIATLLSCAKVSIFQIDK